MASLLVTGILMTTLYFSLPKISIIGRVWLTSNNMILLGFDMVKFRNILIYLFVFLSFTSHREAFALDVKKLFKASKDSVVLIISFDHNLEALGYGSGFFVGKGNTIITNYHVIKGGKYFAIKLNGGKIGKVNSILRYDKKHDLALLGSSYKGNPLPLAAERADVGEDIIAIGNPQGLVGTLSKGLVSGIREDTKSYYYQITAPISPGSSGGPIINKHGQVIGVSTAYLEEGQNLNFAVPSLYIQNLLDKSFKDRIPKQLAKTKGAISQTRKPKTSEIEIGLLLEAKNAFYPSGTTKEIIEKVKGENFTFKIEDKISSGVNRKPRWINITNDTVTDSTTDLMWMTKDFRIYEERAPSSWHEAKIWVKRINDLKFAGYSDWRFPKKEELMNIYDSKSTNLTFRGKKTIGLPLVFKKGGGYWYWTSESFNSDLAWAFGFLSGTAAVAKKDELYFFSSIRLVREIKTQN